MKGPRGHRLLLIIGAAALLLRLAPLLRAGYDGAVLDDSYEYRALVRGMRAGCGFARLEGGHCAPAELLRLPGYPLLVWAFPNLRTVVAGQAALGTATCLMVGWFTASQWSLTAGVIAETLLALDIPSIVASATIMSDCLFQFLLTAAVLVQLLAISRGAGRKATATVLLVAVLLSCTVFVRAVGVILPLLAPLPFLLTPGLRWRQRLGQSLVVVSLPVLLMAAWTVRNHRRSGIWTFTTEAAYNLYYYNAAGVFWHRHGGDLITIQVELDKEAGVTVGPEGPPHAMAAKTYHYIARKGMAMLLADPVAIAVTTARYLVWLAIVPDRNNLNDVLGTNGGSSVFLLASQNLMLRIRDMARSPLLTFLVAVQVPFVVFTWAGVALVVAKIPRLGDAEMRLVVIALAVAFAMILVGTGPGEIARYRMPATPFLAMLAGVGWSPFVRRWHGRTDSEVR